MTNQDAQEIVEIAKRGIPNWLVASRHASMVREGGAIQINGLICNEQVSFECRVDDGHFAWRASRSVERRKALDDSIGVMMLSTRGMVLRKPRIPRVVPRRLGEIRGVCFCGCEKLRRAQVETMGCPPIVLDPLWWFWTLETLAHGKCAAKYQAMGARWHAEVELREAETCARRAEAFGMN